METSMTSCDDDWLARVCLGAGGSAADVSALSPEGFFERRNMLERPEALDETGEGGEGVTGGSLSAGLFWAGFWSKEQRRCFS
jgi:hypothetical protein